MFPCLARVDNTHCLFRSQWLTVLPQLVSRILHPNDRLFDTLEKILLRVLGSYPHHGFWAMASGAKSNGTKRSRRNMKVLEKAKVWPDVS